MQAEHQARLMEEKKQITGGEKSAIVEWLRGQLMRKRVKPDRFAKLVDPDGDGEVTFEEFRSGLNKVGVVLSMKQYRGLLSACDIDGDSEVTVTEVMQTLYVAACPPAARRPKEGSLCAEGAARDRRRPRTFALRVRRGVQVQRLARRSVHRRVG